VEIWVRERNERRAGRKAKIKVLISNNDFCRLEEGAPIHRGDLDPPEAGRQGKAVKCYTGKAGSKYSIIWY
jgi:hypothetical protein